MYYFALTKIFFCKVGVQLTLHKLFSFNGLVEQTKKIKTVNGMVILSDLVLVLGALWLGLVSKPLKRQFLRRFEAPLKHIF